ncbi:MAG: hypothetical protein P8179_01070 [Candidatus Thiodiazotropha sp.]
MNPETYDVYFAGALIKGSDPEKVKRKIGAIFKLKKERLERLFSGKPMPIKHGVDMDRAVKLRVAFRDAGGLVDIVPAGQPAPKPKSAPAPRPTVNKPPAKPTPEITELSLADKPMEIPAEPHNTDIQVPEYPLSPESGFDLSDCAAKVIPQALPDISSLDLNKTDNPLDETPAPKPLEIDTSTLSLSPSNEDSLEEHQAEVEAAPLPNLDHLKIVDIAEEKPQGKAQFKLADD